MPSRILKWVYFILKLNAYQFWVYIKGSFKVDIKVIWQPPNLWRRKPPRTQLPVLESSNINLVGHQNSKEEKTRTTREMFIITDYTNGIHRSHTKINFKQSSLGNACIPPGFKYNNILAKNKSHDKLQC